MQLVQGSVPDGPCPQAPGGAVQPARSGKGPVLELSEPLLAALPSGSTVTLQPPQLEVTEAACRAQGVGVLTFRSNGRDFLGGEF